MRCGYYQRLVVLIFVSLYLSLTTSQAIAAAVPAYNGRMNAAVGAVIQNKVGKWGFAANDPRIGATTTGVASGLTTIAVGVAGGAVATVGWPALLIAAGISAVVGGAVSLAQDAITKWLFNGDGTITQSAVGATAPSQKGDYTQSLTGPSGESIKAGNDQAAADAFAVAYTNLLTAVPPIVVVSEGCVAYADGRGSFCTWGYTQAGYPPTHNWVRRETVRTNTPYTCDGVTINGVCQPPLTTAPAPVTASVPQTVANLSSGDAGKPVSDELLAAAANAAWKAADPSQGGLPWSASDPITPADVAAWRAANPSMVPTVADAVSPVSNGTKVDVAPAPATSPAPAPTPGTGTKVDLGPDPNIGAPILEPTPTASQILSPVLNLMPDLKSFAVPAHSAGCPTPSFVALGKTYTFDSQCALLESNRALIEAAMLLCWTLASVFIVLRA